MADDQNDGSKSEGSSLREQLEATLAENKQLKEQAATGQAAQKKLAFIEAGIEVGAGTGKLLFDTYDGDLTAEAIGKYAEGYGVTAGQGDTNRDEGLEQRQELQQRSDALRGASQPEGAGQRMTWDAYKQARTADPQRAREARENGMVDVPPHIAQNLAASQGEVRLGS